MNSFQWMIRRYTSSDAELSAEELKRLEQRCNELVGARKIWFWLIIPLTAATTALAAMAGGRLFGPLVSQWLGITPPWSRAGCSILCAVIAIAAWLMIYTWMYVQPLRRALTEMGYGVCRQCGYSIRELHADTSRCPECGSDIARIPE